ncbi:MAG TPA: hypothetical protein VLH19_02640 [Patescibacteria group bacterium]|nr:hypothetical protein [Patescibacteria group bacterium]
MALREKEYGIVHYVEHPGKLSKLIIFWPSSLSTTIQTIPVADAEDYKSGTFAKRVGNGVEFGSAERLKITQNEKACIQRIYGEWKRQ